MKKGASLFLCFLLVGILFSLMGVSATAYCGSIPMSGSDRLTCAMYNPSTLNGKDISFSSCSLVNQNGQDVCCCQVYCDSTWVGNMQCGPATCSDTLQSGNYWVNNGKPCGNILSGCYAKSTYYRDSDGDGYGTPSISVLSCGSSGYVSDNTDCNDSNSAVYPGAPEICDGRDNNCNGQVDEGNICSCVESVNYGTITSAGGYWAEGCCQLVSGCSTCVCQVNGVRTEASCWGCPSSLGGSNTNAGAGVGTCVNHWVDTGATTNYFCPGTGCITPCVPNTAAGCAASCTNINKPYWADLRDSTKNISSANLGASVLMIVPGRGLNQAINYSIVKSGYSSWNPTNWFPRIIQQTSSMGIRDWVTSDSGTFWFTANIGTYSNSSDNLIVSFSTADDIPVAVISSPVQGYNASINNPISFNHTSYDGDDFLNVTWNFGDGQTFSVVNYSLALSPNFGNTNHSYSSAGIYLVTLNVTEMIRGKSSIDTRMVQVFQSGLSVYPVIAPINGQAFVGLVASFNASASYVTNCTIGLMPLSFQTNDGKLNCSYLHLANQRTTSGYSLVTNWTIQAQNEVSGNWSNVSNVEFSKLYFQVGTYSLLFRLRYVSSAILIDANKSLSFSIDGGWSCNSTSTTAFWQKGASRLNATNNCAIYNSTYISSCCPTGYTCDGTRCTNAVVRNYCSDFTTQASCLAVSKNSTIARNSVPNITVCNKPALTFNNGTATCYNQTSCLCTWQNNSCTSGLGNVISCPNQPPILPPTPFCFWTYTIEDNCNTTGTRTLKAFASVNSPPDCIDHPQTVACTQTAKLDFITNFSLVAIVLLIIFIYVYLLRKRKSLVVSNPNNKKASSRKIYK